MNSKELAAKYGVSYKTWMSWLKLIREKVGPQTARMWNVNQIKIMFDHFGNPGND